ncbi:MAG: DUF2267 domain-containing protein [Halobacteriota archaeon]
MKYAAFTTEVQNRLELEDKGEAVRAIRAVLTTLAERLQPEEANDLAGPLPMEIDRYLREADAGQRFSFEEYLDRVADIEGTDDQQALSHAETIVGLVSEVVPSGELKQVRSQLPPDFDALFAQVNEDVLGA